MKIEINGGQFNQALGTQNSLVGGVSNKTFSGSQYNTIAGGKANYIFASSIASTSHSGQITDIFSSYSSVNGGCNNVANSNYSSINGGQGNKTISPGLYSSINGGKDNQITYSENATINGGELNVISSGRSNTISGGHQNTIRRSDLNIPLYCSITSGHLNLIDTRAPYDTNSSSIHGGKNIKITSGSYATTYSGQNNGECMIKCVSVEEKVKKAKNS